MQLKVSHKLDRPLVLPISYHHILQSIIYRTLEATPEYSEFLHNRGYAAENRSFKLFTFGAIRGKYRINKDKIIFEDEVSYEIRSIEPKMLILLKQQLEKNGVTYLSQHYENVVAVLGDKRCEASEVRIKMLSPICVYSTTEDGKTIYYEPNMQEFVQKINENFCNKYRAYSGMEPETDVEIKLERLHPKDKYVTKYKGFYIVAWKGHYVLKGESKYLDFLYQTGLGGKNSQGFGMYEII